MKICSKCKIQKDMSDFYKSKSSKDGLYNVCQPMACVPDSCKQLIAVHTLNNGNFSNELSELSKYSKLSSIEK